ncbi:hypothetical protein F5H01DRAFT_347590 [Linnemannia elongata]|nr:hypothetical protein F5H01DRAFT_347590 [Linnemannia elongata]
MRRLAAIALRRFTKPRGDFSSLLLVCLLNPAILLVPLILQRVHAHGSSSSAAKVVAAIIFIIAGRRALNRRVSSNAHHANQTRHTLIARP